MNESNKQAVDVVASCSQNFGLKLYNILHEDRGNILFSSPNIEMVLALLYVGARHKTAEEILSGLELPNDINIIKNGYTAISSSLKNMNTTVFEVVNKLYIEKTFPVEKELSLVAEKTFMTSAENVDFLENSEELHEAMNSWIEKETNAKIQKLFSQNDSTPVSRMVLINAVYFKGKWKTPFNVSNTCKEPFCVSSTESLQVDMMHIKETFGYMPLDELNAQMLVMPYVGDKMCMMILLPNEIDGLHEMENKLNCVKISQLLDSAYIQQVDVSLPRFKVEMTIDLQNLLQKIGINSIFDRETADFANISKERGLFVSKALQKAFIEVSEEGSDTPKAAPQMKMECIETPSKQIFKVDHPFIFYLVNTETNCALVQGRITMFQKLRSLWCDNILFPELIQIEREQRYKFDQMLWNV